MDGMDGLLLFLLLVVLVLGILLLLLLESDGTSYLGTGLPSK
jgi:hypothetical protein